MADLVPDDQIEAKVGALRHARLHRGRAVSAEQTVYILHPQECLDRAIDLRDCPFSCALDRGIDLTVWGGWEDQAVNLAVRNGSLIPSAALDGGDGHG